MVTLQKILVMKIAFSAVGSGVMRFALALSVLVQIACGNREDEDFMVAEDPKQAASQLDQAFASANPQIKNGVENASEAMRTGDYEKAVVNLQMVKGTEALTVEQGLAIHSSVVALEGELIRAAEAGDPNAKRAYDLLRAMKRN